MVTVTESLAERHRIPSVYDNPCRYKFGILVNFFGTFITTGRLPVDDMEYGEGYINSGDEWGFLDGSYSFSEIEEMEGADTDGKIKQWIEAERRPGKLGLCADRNSEENGYDRENEGGFEGKSCFDG